LKPEPDPENNGGFPPAVVGGGKPQTEKSDLSLFSVWGSSNPDFIVAMIAGNHGRLQKNPLNFVAQDFSTQQVMSCPSAQFFPTC
jgi:hypothetical protein